jgi:Zn-dependent protease with chaperone function
LFEGATVAITITCSQCQHTLSVKDEYAGKRGKCPKCQTVVSIPAPATAAAGRSAAAPPPPPLPLAPPVARPTPPPVARPTPPPVATSAASARAKPPAPASAAPADLRTHVLAGFRGEISRVRTTPMYQLGILLTAILMVLLPLLYLAIIGLVCLAVWWHLANNHVIFGAVRGKAALMALVIYAAPLVIGVIVIAFMFKPLFARPANEGRRRSVTPTSDPLLFEFVERICALVGAARPRRIDIDCQINASAGFRRGWLSLLTGRDLVLTIGMPLAAGLSLQQFAGVLAHEFGHFSQGAGMRLTYVIRSINMWFMRVVYQRDAWDEWLAGASEGIDLRVGWILLVARGCVWLTRRILWLLMYVGHVVAGFMLRQMEFDADKYEARVAGSETFAATARQLRMLGIAWQGAEADLASYHREGRLADNLPKLMQSNLTQLPLEAGEFVNKLIAETDTGMFDSHPADRDRIASARAEQAAGVFRSDLPASVLFGSFETAAKGVTWDYYCAAFGTLVDPKTLHSTEELLARTNSQQAASKACSRFFAGAFTLLRPLRLPIINLQKTQHAAIWHEELAQARHEMESLAPVYREAIQAFDQADTRLIQSRQARSILSTGIRLQAQRFEQAFDSAADAARTRDQALQELGRLGNKLETFEEAAGRRLRADLMLLFDPQVARRLEGAEAMQAECRELLPLVAQASSLHTSLLELRNCNATLVALLGHIEGNERSEELVREVLDYAGRVRTQAADLRNQFERVDYPFDHAHGKMSVAQFLLKIVPPAEEVGSIYEAGDQVLNKLMELWGRAISRLCLIAEAVEADHGLQPLPLPLGLSNAE